jgi:hypothetical protein
MLKQSVRVMLVAFALGTFSTSDAQPADDATVFEALFAQVESLGLDKTYFVREQEGRPPNLGPEYPVRFPAELVVHSREDFGKVRVSFVDESFLSGLWDSSCQDGWLRFHERYPEAGDLTQVSRVLFDESGDQASIYLEQGRGCRSSCGATYQLARQAAVWAVVGRTGGWCS